MSSGSKSSLGSKTFLGCKAGKSRQSSSLVVPLYAHGVASCGVPSLGGDGLRDGAILYHLMVFGHSASMYLISFSGMARKGE